MSPQSITPAISTPDRRLRVLVSSPELDLAPERAVAQDVISALQLTPVGPEAGAPGADTALFAEADIFVGIYWQTSPDPDAARAAGKPRIIYVKEPATGRDPTPNHILEPARDEGSVVHRTFQGHEDLARLLADDLSVLVAERFHVHETDASLSSGTLTFMFADLEGSTGMLQRLEEGYKRLLESYHRLVHSATDQQHGHVVTIEGDGFFCVFPSAVDALEAARSIQEGMAGTEWPEGEHPRCRIGIHTGNATRTMEGYVGIDVHVAARIGAAANGGQVIVSTVTSGLVSSHADAHGWRLMDLGQFELRGIDRSERLLRVDMPGLDVVLSSLRARPRMPSSVPATPKRLVGRVDDVRGATEMLMRDAVRLVTLTGTGGTGKTRLAVELARRLDREFADGVVFVDLSAVSDPDRLLPVVGRALGVRESSERTITAGLAAVVGDASMMVVLDNLEQLLPAAGGHISDLIESMPNSKFLVTSRAPLRIGWEHEYPLPPLQVPEPGASPEEADQTDAVVLFVERAQAARPLFELNEVTRPVVVEVVRRLDGLPLAIELAAARLRVFTVEELQQRLDDRLAILDRSSADAPERHKTLRSAIQWSYDLLEEAEKSIFRRLAVFAGGWTLSAAIAVCADDDFTEPEVLDIMEELVAKSLVVFSIDASGRPRYRLLETLREFGLDQLRAHEEEMEVRLRHLAHIRELAERVAVVLPTPDFPTFLDEVERDRFNVREALAWSVANRAGTDDALMICGMLPLFFDVRGYVAEGLRWCRALVAMTTAEGNTEPRGMAHTAMGWLEMLAGEPEESDWALATAERMFREMHNDAWLGRALAMRGMTTYNRDLLDDSEEQFNEAIVLCRENGLDWLADAWCTYGLAHIALNRGDFPTAEERLHHVLDYSKSHSLAWGIGHVQLSLGVMSFMLGDLQGSVDRVVESMLVRQELRDSRGLCDCLGMMALHASVRGDHQLSALLLGAAEVAREASGDHLVPWQRPLIEQATQGARSALGEAFDVHFEEGRGYSMAEAIALILERFPVSQSSAEAVATPT